jgi:hypothetical protein
VPTKIVLIVGFLERDFERDHLAEKTTGQKWAKKYTVHGPDITLLWSKTAESQLQKVIYWLSLHSFLPLLL